MYQSGDNRVLVRGRHRRKVGYCFQKPNANVFRSVKLDISLSSGILYYCKLWSKECFKKYENRKIGFEDISIEIWILWE